MLVNLVVDENQREHGTAGLDGDLADVVADSLPGPDLIDRVFVDLVVDEVQGEQGTARVDTDLANVVTDGLPVSALTSVFQNAGDLVASSERGNWSSPRCLTSWFMVSSLPTR